MVGAEFLAAMPDGAVLVNASRGGVVETSALVAELRSGRLRAVLDVVDPDPLPPGHALWKMPGVLITPHVGGIGTEASWRERAYAVVPDQLVYVVRGRLPPNLVVHGY
jgi:phosphoglycerate dehydrogenase-like enzyme